MNETLWGAKDEEGNECSLLRDPDGNILWSMDGGLYFSGYPSIKLNKEQMEELVLALMIELCSSEFVDVAMNGEADETVRPPRLSPEKAGERKDSVGRRGIREILGGGDILRQE